MAGGSDHTVCGSATVLDNAWLHVAVRRYADTDLMSIDLDGVLSGSGTGPAGSISYPADGLHGHRHAQAASRVYIQGIDVFVSPASRDVILTSPDRRCRRVIVSNPVPFQAVRVNCPQ